MKSTQKFFKTIFSTVNRPAKFCGIALIALLTFSCSSDDNNTPPPVNEEELITTVTAIYTPEGGGSAITLQYKDLDGEGANAPVVTVSEPFAKNTTYNGSVTFKNELANPVDDITAEIVSEGEAHQIFYQKTGNLTPFVYGTAPGNFDSNGKVIGLQSVFTTAGEASGSLTITLRHEPNKNAANVSAGDIANAGGSTDAEVTFAISVL